jgi:hypothetical protein
MIYGISERVKEFKKKLEKLEQNRWTENGSIQ